MISLQEVKIISIYGPNDIISKQTYQCNFLHKFLTHEIKQFFSKILSTSEWVRL